MRLPQGRGHVKTADNGASHHIVVAGQVFGHALDHQIYTMLQGAQIDGRGEGGIDHGLDVARPGQGDQAVQVDTMVEGIGGRFGKNHLGVRADGGFQRRVVTMAHHGRFDAIAGQKILAKLERAQITLVGKDQVITGGKHQQ